MQIATMPTKPASPAVTTPAAVDPPANLEVLMLPALTPEANSYEEFRRARITYDELVAAKTPGVVVSESVVCALLRHEEIIFQRRVRALRLEYLLEAVTVLRMADSAWLVNMAEKHGVEPLKDTTIVLDLKKEGAGFYDKLRREIGLGKPSEKLLVPFGLVGNNHFSLGFYLPQTGEIIRPDSHRPSKHEELTAASYTPFFEFVHSGTLKVSTKDERHGVERQPAEPIEDSNVCGFAAALFLSKGLTELLNIAEKSSEPMELPTLGAALSAALHKMTVAASSYKVRRRVGKGDLSRLVVEYNEIRRECDAAKANEAATPNEAAKPPAPNAKPPAAKPPAAKPRAAKPPAAKPADDALAGLIASKRKREAQTAAMKASPPTSNFEFRLDLTQP